MMRKTGLYKLGIVGCGNISRVHAHAIRANKSIELVSAFSRSDERRTAFCNEFGITGYSDYDEFLNSDDLDAVVLCTPNGTHLDFGLEAANAGKHLIIEKPLEVTVERGQKLLQACRSNGVHLAVIYQSRFIEDVRKMKKAVDSGLIGRPVMVRVAVKWYRDQEYFRSAPWRGSLKLDGGGALINQSIHTVDLMLWMAGPVASIQAYKGTLTHEGIEGEDNLVASMHFKNGALGVLEASTSIVPSQDRRIEINGTSGTAILTGDSLRIHSGNHDAGKDASEMAEANKPGGAGSSSPLQGLTYEQHSAQYREIFNHIDKGLQPPVSGGESLNSLAFVQSAYLSADSQTAVSPDDLFPYHAEE
jgi:UDP-N-acetyl-2-amino-2-deoxyglucuronate dehydrogenase